MVNSEVSGVPRLGGQVARLNEFAYSGGVYCDIWVGWWDKGHGGGEGAEKVSLSRTTSIPLTWPHVGSLESTESTQVTGKDTQGSILGNQFYTPPSCPPSPVIRSSKVNSRDGQSCAIRTFYRSMVCMFPELSPETLPWSYRGS